MDPRERNESATSTRSSLGLLRSDAISDFSEVSGYNSSTSSSVFMGFHKESEDCEEEALEGTLEEEDEDEEEAVGNSVFNDFEPTPVAFRQTSVIREKSVSLTSKVEKTPQGLPANLLVPSESTPNTPSNPCALPSSVQRLLQSLVSNSIEDHSNLSWDKLFSGGAGGGGGSQAEPPSFCTGQFSARSTSFGTTNSSSANTTREEDLTNSRTSSIIVNSQQHHHSSSNISQQYVKENPFGSSSGAAGTSSESGCFFESMKGGAQEQENESFAKEEEFHSLDSQFIDEAEKENNNKYRFIQEQAMSSSSDVTNPSKLGFSQCLNNTHSSALGGHSEEQLSRSQYFMMNTSRLGNSICNATDDSSRPNLGFGTIKSPKLKPRPLLEKSSNNLSSSCENSTYNLSEDSSLDKVRKKLSMPDSDCSLSINDSKILEEALKKKLSSEGQLDLNFISMLMNNSSGGSRNDSTVSDAAKKGSADYLVSMILKTLEVSGGGGKKPSPNASNMSMGTLPSFLETTTAANTKEEQEPKMERARKKSSHGGARHSSPIRSSGSRLAKLKIQPIKSVIKSSKSVDNDTNVSIVMTESLSKRPTSSSSHLQVLTREGDKIDFGILPEDCSTTEDLVLVHSGQSAMEIRLEIQGQLPSFIYPTDGQTNLIKMISSKTISLTLPAIPLSTPGESVATSIKISIHTPAYGAPELRSLTSQINILCEGKLLAQVPMVARVGQVKLQTLKASKIPVLNCTPNGSWFDHSVPMMNVGNIQMTISLELAGPSTVGKFQLEQSLMILQPGKEYLGHFKFKPLELGEEELILRCTVQPNGTTYEVPIRISSKQPSLDKEDNIKLPLVQLGKLSLQPTCSSPRALKSTVFPVEADKSFMNWISIPLGASEEQILTLKNALSEPISLTLLIRDSELFKVKDKNDEYKRFIEVESLPGNGTLSVRVAFQPTEKKNSLDLGKLIIKPRLGVGGKIYKATIMLQGNSGAPEFMFSGFGDEVNGKQSLFLGQLGEKPIVKSLSIRNKGSGPGFVSCMALGHHGALSEAIRFDKPQAAVVLYPNESTLIRFTVDPTRVPMGDKNQVFIGFIHVYTGSELARSAMKKAAPKASPSLKLKIQSSSFGGGLLPNFEEGFDGEREAFMGSVSYFDVKNFYKTARKMVVELSGISSSKDETLLKFNALPVEETLSESRMDSTQGLQPPPPHSPPTRCPKIPEEPRIFEIHDDDIFIESRKTVLVTLVNATNAPQRFDLSWPAHILMVQPSSGSVGPKMRETIAITAIAQEERKGSISVHTDTETQAIAFHVLPLKFTVEPDKIKFAHSGTEQRISLKNHMDAKLLWEVKESDSNFFLSLKAGELQPRESIDLSIRFQPRSPGIQIEKTICFLGKGSSASGGGPLLTLLEVSGGQALNSAPSPQSLVSSNTPNPGETSKKSVYLDKESISFPPTRVGEHSTAKIIVKNRLSTVQSFNVEALVAPFSTKYTETAIVIKPMSFLRFPVSFSPSTPGEYCQNIVLRNNNKILVGILNGSCP